MGSDDALALAKKANKVVVSKGAKVSQFDVKKGPESIDDIAGAMLGPTGNLRAPTIRAGKTVLVGFNEDVYTEHLT
ncbi:MAG: hypothetical protein DHS20C16_28920 [Phycisphaerae bacterium]|nr:MAG: hypothetical protein DHS20C16_28920 [Phycisphaerae bacterium]